MDVAAVDHALMTTRSVRRRIDFDRPVEPEVIEACIDVAVQAPTGLNAESWRFLVVDDAPTKERIARLYRESMESLAATLATSDRPPLRPGYRYQAERLQDMPALILVCSEGRPAPAHVPMQVGFFGSVLPAAWSLMVALRARGIGATWTSLLTFREDEVSAILGIPPGVTQTVLLPIGYTRDAKLGPAARRSAGEVTYWNRWGSLRGGAG